MTKTYVIDTNMTEINKWREKQKTRKIKIDSISVDHNIHRDANEIVITPGTVLSAYNGGRPIPIIIRETTTGAYQLLFGLKQILIAQSLNHTKINSIIVSKTREDFIESINNPTYGLMEYNIKDIIISTEFANAIPGAAKVKNKTKEIKAGNIKPIEIDHSTGVLVDGYVTYLILRDMGIEKAYVYMPKRSA